MKLIGLAAIWRLSPVMAAALVVAGMPLAIVGLALLQGTFGWRNPALYIGDPALAIAVGIAGAMIGQLPVELQRRIISLPLQATLVCLGWLLAGVSEWLSRWQADQRHQEVGAWRFILLSYHPSDIYHFALYGPLAAIVVMSLVIVLLSAFRRPALSTISCACVAVACVASWAYLAWLTGEMIKGNA